MLLDLGILFWAILIYALLMAGLEYILPHSFVMVFAIGGATIIGFGGMGLVFRRQAVRFDEKFGAKKK